MVGCVQSWGAIFIWNGGGVGVNWSTAANWVGGVAPANNGTAAIVLAGAAQLSPNVDAAWDISSLAFSNNASAFVLGGNALNIRAGGVTNSSANGQTINNSITLATNQTWSATSGILTFNGNINNVTNLLTIAGNFNSFVSGVISGTGGITKIGTGTNFLSGNNTYTGVTTVSAGVINIQNGSALGSANAGTTVASGATLQLQGGITVTNQNLTLNGNGISALGALRSLTNNNTWNGTITLASASTIGCDADSLTLGAGGIVNSTFLLTITDVGNVNVTGSIGNGSGGLTKAGAGTLTLNATNSYGGLTTVSVGVLNVQNSSALGSTLAGTTVASGAQLQLQGGITVAGETLSLSGTGIANSGAIRNLSGSNSWSGTMTLAAASTIDADAGTLDLEANIINATFTATFTNNGAILLNGVLGNGTGGLTKIGSGILVVNGTNNYTGATTISGGVLQFGATGNLPSASAITVNAGAALDLNNFGETIGSLAGAGNVTLGGGTLTVGNATATTFSGVMSGTGNLTKVGSSTLTLSGTNTYSGGTAINGGVISIATDSNLGDTNGPLTLNGGTLTTSVNLTSARAITLGANGGIINPGATTLTLSGIINGSGALSMIGTGTLALSGSNTYLGGTTNSAGIISIDSDARLGTASGPLTFSASATLTTTASFSSARNIFLNGGTATFSAGGGFANTLTGVISGPGALTKTGAGTLTLSSSNTYSGLTAVSVGVLNVQNSAALGSTAAGTTVASGAALQLQGGISVAGETLSLNGAGIANNGAIRNISGSNSWSGAITLAAASTLCADAGTLDLEANLINTTFTATFTNNGAILLNGVLGNGTGGLTKIGSGILAVNGTNNYTGATTISGGVLQFGTTGNLPSASAVTVNAGSTLDVNSLNESILALAGAGSVTLGSGTLTVNNSAATTFSGVMSGAGSLVKASGTGTMTMSGVNTYTGGTTINAGAISIAAATGIGNATNALTLNGGTLIASAALTSARAITLGLNGGTFNETANATLTLSGVISGPGALTKIGTRTLALTGTNTYLGGTTNSAGTITVNSDAALGDPSGPVTFSASATLTTTASFSSTRNIFLNAGTATYNAGTGFTNTLSGVISGAGALTKSGTGILLLSGNNTFTNTLTISAGTLQLSGNERIADLTPVIISATTATLDLNNFNETIGSLASTAAGKVTLGSGSLTAGGNNTSTTLSAVISGTGNFTKAGTGVMIFSGANTYTGATTVGAGTLQISASERIANTSPLVVSNAAVFNLNNFSETIASLAGGGSVTLGSGAMTAGSSSSVVFAGVISGTGAFTKVGTGMQTFSGTNTYTGATTVSVGNLQVNGSTASSAVTMSSGATLSGGGTVGTVTGASGSTNAPGSTGPGTLTSGAQTWAGGENYIWEISNPAGGKGSNPGWDWMNISGTLTINATPASKFNIKIVSLNLANAAAALTNFDNTATYIWTIASASGGITGFDPAKFNLDTSAFQNFLGAGTFAVSQSGNDLNLIFTSAAQATVKGVQSGTLTSFGNGTNIATLGTAVNPTNAFLLFNTRHNSGVPGGSMIRGRITSSNSVEFVRATTETATMNIQWYVVEYAAGVRVQRGEVNQTNPTLNVPLTPIASTNQAFVTWSKTPDPTETTFSDSDPVVGEITATTNLQFRVGAAPSSVPVISWQVIEFLNPASLGVQKGSVPNLTGTNLLATVTLAAPVNTNSTFLLTGYRTSGSGTSVGARMLRAQLADASTITFDRSISGAPDDISEIFWQAVQLNDGSLVQRGTVNFTNGTAETNVTITSLNTNRAAAFASVQPAGGQNTGRSPSTGGVLGVGSATLAMTGATQLTLDRNNTSDQMDAGWFVVGFGPGTLLTPATGGSAISADTTGGAYTSLTGLVYTETQNGNVGAGTIILKAPAGFIFDTNATQPTVLITRVGGSGANALNINGVASGTSAAMTTVNQSNLIFTVTSASSGGVICSLAWQNLRVRPAAGTPLASGNLVDTGTAVIQGVTTSSTGWGFLAEVVGTATKLAISTTPSSAVTAGVDFPQQPVIQIQDQFGNLRAADNTNVITAASSGTDTNDVNGSVTAVGGVAAFSGMSYQIAQTNTITFSAPGLTSKSSSNIVVSAAAANQVTVVTQPSATVTAGVPFTQQPVVQVQDAFGNLRKTDNSTAVTASINQGSGNLFGRQTFTAVNGVVTFTNLSYQIAETITIDFNAAGLDLDTSTGIAVGAAPASQLVIQTQPAAVATAGVPFPQQPVILIQDQFGNLCATNNSTVVTASRNAGSGSGGLQGSVNVTASGGVATFVNLAHNVAGTISIDFNSSALTSTTSSSLLVNPAGVAKLAFATQPGSATVGSIIGIQPAIITQDAYGNNSVSGLANSLNVTMALTSGTGTLQGTTNLDIGISAGNGTVSFTDLRIDSVGSKQLTASASGLTSAVSASFSVVQGNQTIAFGSLPNKTYGEAAFGVSASASSGLPVTFSIASGPASVSSSNVTITGAGTVTVRTSQPGNTNYLAAAPVDQSFTVAKADLNVTADNQSRIYGAANPTFTASYSGFVNGDNSSVLSGTPVLSTTATTASSVAGSPYPITVTNGTLSAANYSFNFISGQLTITPANSALAVSTSANPSTTGSNVTFTATVSAVAPGTGTPAGRVNFRIDGSGTGSSTLSGGVATVTTNSLAHGSHTVVAEYAGDLNFTGTTNSLTANQVINTPPVAGSVTIYRNPVLSVKVRLSTLLAYASDADGDALNHTVSSTSASNATVTVSGGWVFYTPPAGFTNIDSFTYTVTDGYGGSAVGTVTVAIQVDNDISQNLIITDLGNGSFLIKGSGIPGYTYRLQYSDTAGPFVWQDFESVTADSIGTFSYTDTPPTNSPPRFYRSTDP